MSGEFGTKQLAERASKHAEINSSAASFKVLDSESDNKQFVVTALVLAASGAGTVEFWSSATRRIGVITFKAADPPMVLPRNGDGWLVPDISKDLRIVNSGALTLTGFLTYYEK